MRSSSVLAETGRDETVASLAPRFRVIAQQRSLEDAIRCVLREERGIYEEVNAAARHREWVSRRWRIDSSPRELATIGTVAHSERPANEPSGSDDNERSAVMPAETDFTSRALSSAKQKSQQLLDAAQDRSRQMVDSAQHYVRENPVRAASYSSAVVLGLGILIGRLLAPHPFDAASAAAFARGRLRALPGTARETSEELLAAAKETSQQLADTTYARSRELLKSTRQYVEENPRRAASYAAGALFGVAAIIVLLSAFGERSGTRS